MSERSLQPRTEAGRALLRANMKRGYGSDPDNRDYRSLRDMLAAIEAAARAEALDEVRRLFRKQDRRADGSWDSCCAVCFMFDDKHDNDCPVVLLTDITEGR